MTAERWRRIEAVFSDVRTADPAVRGPLLDVACAGDGGLRAEVEALLAADVGAESFFAGLAASAVPTLVGFGGETASGASGDRVGPWRLVRLLGRGGMGEVWLAERAEGGFEQTAALKLVRPGLGPADARRFQSERQILARLDHPGVARLLGGGVAADGRPYLAMEHVEGAPITDYADRHRLTVDDRLALFEQVAAAVHAAHQIPVVHRDLKPSNVLVTAGGAVKLLDFGVAKLLDDGDDLAQTRTGAAPLTPAYAAPEQVRGEPPTTSTDVYALGVLLYELLTGCRPYRLAGWSRAAVERAVLHAEPTRPSEAVIAPAEGAPDPPALGAARRAEPGRLRRRLAGDLDRIVLQALEKDPARRYPSADAFAADVRRHLDGFPVRARAGSRAYRARRFVRRHRAGVAAASLAVVALLVGSGAALWQAAEADRQRDRAERRAAEAQALSAFLFTALAEGDPQAAEPRRVAETAVVLRSVEARLARGFRGPPRVRADLYAALGMVSVRAHRLAEALPLLHRARAAYEATGDVGSTAYQDVLFRLADLHRNRGDADSARAYYRRVVGLAEAAGRADGRQAWSLLWLATLAPDADRRRALLTEAETVAAHVRPEDEAPAVHLGVDHMPAERRWAFRRVRLPLAYARHAPAPTAERVAAADRARQQAEREGFDDLAAYALFARAEALTDADPGAARRDALEARRQTAAALGPDHPRVPVLLHGLARIALAEGWPDRAIAYADSALAAYRASYGDVPTLNVAEAAAVAGEARLAAGLPATAPLREAVATYEALVVPDDPRLAAARAALVQAAGRGERP